MNEQYNSYQNPAQADERALAIQRRKRERRLRRKRLEYKVSTFSVLLLMLVFGGMGIYMVTGTRSTVSQVEKRNLTQFPEFSWSSYFSGEFTNGVTQWFDDTVPNRDSLKNAGISCKNVFGLRGTEDVTFVNQPKPVRPIEDDEDDPYESLSVETTPTPSTAPVNPDQPTQETVPSQPTQPAETEEDPRDYTGEDAEADWEENGLLIVNQDNHWRCMELFGGGGGSLYAQTLNDLYDQVGDRCTIYSMPAPLASEFYVPAQYKEYSASQVKCFDTVHKKLNPGIVALNICPILAKHTEEPIYCRTDHHWMPLGAYYASQAFCKAANVPVPDLKDYTQDKNEGFVGTMYAFSGDSRIKDDPEDFVFYVPKADYETFYYGKDFDYIGRGNLINETDAPNSYLMFLGGDTYSVKVKTAVKNGRKLVLIKDSYGNAEVPFYTSSFEEIYVVDLRYFRRNLVTFIDSMGITDVLFSMCSFSVVGGIGEFLPELLTQDLESTVIVDEQLEYETPEPAADTETAVDTTDEE